MAINKFIENSIDAINGTIEEMTSVDDGGTSFITANKSIKSKYEIEANVTNFDSDYMKAVFHGANLFSRNEFRNNLYNGTFRFGTTASIHEAIGSNCREYLFFTKPNLNILAQDNNGNIGKYNLHEAIENSSFWEELFWNRRNVIYCLEGCHDTTDKFNHLLQNMVISNLEIPSLDSDTIETAVNKFGVGYSYRGTSEASDDNPEFTLEFKDTKYLDVYYYFKAYEEYETLKHHGIIGPSQYYPINKIIHDQFSIYKFIVDEDGETILYYGKMFGVMPKGLPRDSFSNPNFESGLTYNVNFKAAFYEDMNPEILMDFNSLSGNYFNSLPYYITPYNGVFDRTDTRIAKSAFVFKDYDSAIVKNSPGKFVYKLKWKGDMKI